MHDSDTGHETMEATPRSRSVPLWVLVCLLALLLMAVGYIQFWLPLQARRNLAAQIESLGGSVEYREVGPDWLRKFTGRSRSPTTLSTTGGILDQVKSVRICPSQYPIIHPHGPPRVPIPQELVRQLRMFEELTLLDLSYTTADDDWLPDIAELKSLRLLGLTQTLVQGDGFHHLARLHDLKLLKVRCCPIHDQN
ncbi:MAG: hypothetical protein AB7U20_25605, partial [Planctomycetaceae bacterium]